MVPAVLTYLSHLPLDKFSLHTLRQSFCLRKFEGENNPHILQVHEADFSKLTKAGLIKWQ